MHPSALHMANPHFSQQAPAIVISLRYAPAKLHFHGDYSKLSMCRNDDSSASHVTSGVKVTSHHYYIGESLVWLVGLGQGSGHQLSPANQYHGIGTWRP